MEIPKLETPKAGHAIHFQNDYFQYIGKGSNSALHLSTTNKRKVHCRDCNQEILPGQGIWRASYGSSGYLCIADARKFIKDNGGIGYIINIWSNLQAVNWREDIYTADVICSLLVRVSNDGNIQPLD